MAINPSDDVDVLGTFLRILLNNDRWHKQRQEIIIDQTSSTPIACLSSYDLSLLLAIVWCRWCHVKGDRGHRSWRMIMIYTIKCWCTCTISIKLKYIQQSTKRWLIKIIQQYTIHWERSGTNGWCSIQGLFDIDVKDMTRIKWQNGRRQQYTTICTRNYMINWIVLDWSIIVRRRRELYCRAGRWWSGESNNKQTQIYWAEDRSKQKKEGTKKHM